MSFRVSYPADVIFIITIIARISKSRVSGGRRPPPPPGRAGLSASGNSRFGNYGNSGNYKYDVNRVGHTKIDSLGTLELPFAATEREIKVQYKRLARIYHPDTYNPTTNPMIQFEAQNI